ncbi:hypothetical protein [Rhizohabitans arisaemae]|uniref:hypothetical protein n=1 Tax=Rhizohabitans arisaemae TaxID=2720610 RepID=UPI0024B281DD|nr:hypothetical protein [Rhizohabitans arisaemae]
MSSHYAEEMRRKAEEILSRAREDSAFADRLKADPRAVLAEIGVPENARLVDLPVVLPQECEQTCVDFTCIFTPSLCPETCLPFGTIVFCDVATHV